MLLRFIIALASLAIPKISIAQEVDTIFGKWRTVQHDAVVSIVDCGDVSPCATLSWVSEEIMNGASRDIRNRSQDLRDRPLIGLPIFGGFHREDGGWSGGWIYNPEYGRAYPARLQLMSESELRVTGCLGSLCLSQTWQRIQ